MTMDFTPRSNRSGVFPHDTPHPSDTEPQLWSLRDAPSTPESTVVFEGQTTKTADGRTEYTASLAELPPEEQMTHWLTVDATHVVSLENSR